MKRRAVLWLILLGGFFFLSYGFANEVAARSGVTRTCVFAWEGRIPFLPWTILPYWSIDLVYALSFFGFTRKEDLDRHALRLLTVQLISVACFLLVPLRFSFARPEVEGVSGALFNVLAAFDQPYNQAPSLHIGLLVILWDRVLHTCFPRGAVHLWALLVGLSVLTTWQHHFIDVPTGVAVGLLGLWIWPEGGHCWSKPSATARRLAGVYAVGAGALTITAGSLGGLALGLFWSALSLLLVAVAYAFLGGHAFLKRQGRHPACVKFLLGPYLIGARINAFLWNRRSIHPVPIAGGVWLGPLPGAATLAEFASICDLAPELEVPRGPWRIHSLPWMDLVPPSREDLRHAAQTIEDLRAHGPVLVACALGRTRSAAAVVAWLRFTGRAPTLEHALAWVRAVRPEVALGPEWREVLGFHCSNMVH